MMQSTCFLYLTEASHVSCG